jgi:hypothetical protein
MEISMDGEPTAESQANAGASRAAGRGAARIPGKAPIVLGLFLLAAGVMAVHTALIPKDSGLRLKVQHSFRSAQLWVWLDDELAYSGRLIGSSKIVSSAKSIGFSNPIRSSKKSRSRMKISSDKKVSAGKPNTGLIEPVEGGLSEMFDVSPGAHEVRVRVATEDGSVQENTIRGDFASASLRTLFVVARGDDVSMNWQGEDHSAAGAPSPVPEPVTPREGWFQRYAGSLFLSVIGSIISAVTGYAIRELPKKIIPEKVEVSKARSAGAGR